MWTLSLTLVVAMLSAGRAAPGEVRVAVASNFARAAAAVAERFEATTGHAVVLVPGSTGKHYAQIRHGAPFDVFLAADVARPERLERDGAAIAGTRFTYALGTLVLWSPRGGHADAAALTRGDYRYLAMANPRLAPYGRAAEETLRGLGAWESVGKRVVRGENVGQAYQFVASGNAELGFVARSQLDPARDDGAWWEVPQRFYTPIEQQAVQLREGSPSRDFLSFLAGEEARHIIRSFGYQTP